MDAKTMREIKRECRAMAHELMLAAYATYDSIWWDRIKIDSALLAHGKETIREINQRMPNLLTHDWNVSPLDIVAMRYGFENDSDLVEYLLAYRPRRAFEEKKYNELLDQYLHPENEEEPFDVVPF